MIKNAIFLSILRPAPPLLALLLTALVAPATAAAGQFQVFGSFGVTFPFYSQTLTYDPGPVSLPIPGITIRQEGMFSLEAKGGTAYGFGGCYYFVSSVGLEARVDFAGVDIQTSETRYLVNVTLAPFPPINADLEVGEGTVDVDRLTPISFNVRFQTPGRFALGVSGGISYLPSFRFAARQTLTLGVIALNAQTANLELSNPLPFAAIVQPEGEGQSRWGFNGGVLLRIPFNEKVALVGDARYFRFSEHTVNWTRADNRPLSAIEQLLLAQVQQRLDPIRFRPQWFQVTGGLAITF